ncbi:MAG: gamma-glutamyltransferase [Planctomycetes bacterium]|nr:gamma-glutamyltransferase [Planctomycetota bacterium]
MKGTPLALVLSALSLCSAQDRPGPPFVTRSEVIARHGMVATSQPLATQAALEILKKGGNAVDAAIAADALLGVVEPTGSGIGGDLFALVWSAKEKQLYGLNASGRSPRGLPLEKLRVLAGDAIPKFGPLPVTVPGCVDGWFELHGRFGKLPMGELLAPAIAYAREGFPASELIARAWRDNAKLLADQPGFAAQFMPAPEKGQIVKRENLARTLERIAREGRDVFYRGELAAQMADFLQANGGFLAREDFAAHRSEWVTPLSTNYRGYDVWELPPNGQGLAALEMLNLLEGFDLAKLGFGSADALHLFAEAKKLAFEDRARYYADPDFAEAPLAQLVSKEYAAQRRKLIDPKRAARHVEAGRFAPVSRDTITLATADEAGNMVALIQSNYRGMGSGLAPTDLGFVFQDRGELFDLTAGRANSYAPGKRPFHTIIPGFVTKDGEAWLAFGVMGGDFQPQGHVEVLTNLIDFGMNLQEACDAPRFAHEGSTDPTGEAQDAHGGVLALESGFAPAVLEALKKRGHVFAERKGIYGGFQGIRRDAATGTLYGASDSRKDGQAAGW